MTDTNAPYEWKESCDRDRARMTSKRQAIILAVEREKKKVSDFVVGMVVVFDSKFTSEDVAIYHESVEIPDHMFKARYVISDVERGWLFNIEISSLGRRFDYRVLKLV